MLCSPLIRGHCSRNQGKNMHQSEPSGLHSSEETFRGYNRFATICDSCEAVVLSGEGRVYEGPELNMHTILCNGCTPVDQPPQLSSPLPGCPSDTWGKMFAYQREGAKTLAANQCFGMFDAMGLGKSLQALGAISANSRSIVVCPAIVKGVWEREVGQWRPDLRAIVVKGRRGFRLPEVNEVVIMNYEILPDAPLPAHPTRPGESLYLIADEAHYLKNARAKRTKRFKMLAKQVHHCDGRVWLLTGTPMVNNPLELRCVLSCAPGLEDVFGNYWNFVRLFRGYQAKWGMKWGTPDPIVAELLKRVSIRRRKADVLEQLPDLIEEVEKIPVTKELKALLDGAALEWQNWIDEKPGTRANQLPPIGMLSKVRAALATSRLRIAQEWQALCHDEEEPLIIFSSHRDIVLALGQTHKWGSIVGGTPEAERNKLIENFQGGKLDGLALTIGAGSTGITLTRAARMLFVDLPWTPAELQQARDRIHRVGQTRGVIITYLVANHPIDRRVLQLLQQKKQIIDITVENSAR